jgi:HEAT repeat protein
MIISSITLATLVLSVGAGGPSDAAEIGGKPLSHWAKALRDKDPLTRTRAAMALGFLGPAASETVPDLVDLLDDQESIVRSEAAEALGMIGPKAEAAIPALASRLGDLQFADRLTHGGGSKISNALAMIGARAVPAITKVLVADGEKMPRQDAARALGRIGPTAAGSVEALISATENSDDGIRRKAIEALGRIGPAAARAIPALKAALHRTGEFRGEEGPGLECLTIVKAMADIGASPMAELADDLASDRIPKRYRAAQLIVHFGPKAKPLIPRLIRATRDGDLKGDAQDAEELKGDILAVRAEAAAALSVVDPGSAVVISALVDVVKANGSASNVAAAALGQLGPAAKDALPAVLDAFKRGNRDLRLASAPALVQIAPGKTEILPPLISSLTDEDHDVREAVLVSLGRLGSLARPAIPAILRAFFGEENVNCRRAAAEALGRIGPAASSAVPALIKILKDDNSDVRIAAVESLGRIGPAASSAVAALVDLLKDKRNDSPLRRAAGRALVRIGPAAKGAVAGLKRSLKEKGGADVEVVATIARLDENERKSAMEYVEKLRDLYSRAVVLGALGLGSPEAEGFTRIYLRRIDAALDPYIKLAWSRENLFEIQWVLKEVLIPLGPGAKSAIPRLNELLVHPNVDVRIWARDALEEIESNPGK